MKPLSELIERYLVAARACEDASYWLALRPALTEELTAAKAALDAWKPVDELKDWT